MRVIVCTLLLLMCAATFATPSTLVYIPSTDIQPTRTWHLDEDAYIFTNGAGTPEQAPGFVDVGLLYGVAPRWEAGFDVISGAKFPLWFNVKYLVLPPDKSPVALAVGAYNWNLTDNQNSQDMVYVVGSSIIHGKAFPCGWRVTYGYYAGNSTGLTNAFGADDTSGVLLGLDRTYGKWWFGLDYQSGQNAVGALNPGIEYSFTPDIGVIFGYDYYNDHRIPGSFNVQLDANFK